MQINSSLKERLHYFLEYKNISRGKFGLQIGASRSWANNIGDSLRKAMLDKIKAHYPELNIHWLLTGEGEMIKEIKLDEIKSVEYTQANNYSSLTGFKNEADYIKENERLKKMVDLLLKWNERLEKENQELKKSTK